MNSHYDYVIIGGGPAGTIAAEEIRKFDQNGSIGIITDETHQLYSRVLLPNFLRDEAKREQVFLRHDNFYIDNKIDLISSTIAEELFPNDKKVKTNKGDVTYQKLLIANGGKVSKWSVPGSENTSIIYNLRTLEDADRVREAFKTVKKPLLIGGGFIGLEFANSTLKHGLKPTLLVREPYFWSNLLAEPQSKLLTENLTMQGAEIILGDEVDHIETKNNQTLVVTKSQKQLETDFIGVGVGIKLQTEWLQSSGIKTNKGVLTNEFLETNLPDVWAAGDIAEYFDPILEKVNLVGNWANAREQGKVVGQNMAGQHLPFEFVSNYSIISQGLNIAFVGSVFRDDQTEVINRFSDTKAAQIFVKNNRIMGATLIHMVREKISILNLIANKTDISAYRDHLANPNSDLTNIK